MENTIKKGNETGDQKGFCDIFGRTFLQEDSVMFFVAAPTKLWAAQLNFIMGEKKTERPEGKGGRLDRRRF